VERPRVRFRTDYMTYGSVPDLETLDMITPFPGCHWTSSVLVFRSHVF